MQLDTLDKLLTFYWNLNIKYPAGRALDPVSDLFLPQNTTALFVKEQGNPTESYAQET